MQNRLNWLVGGGQSKVDQGLQTRDKQWSAEQYQRHRISTARLHWIEKLHLMAVVIGVAVTTVYASSYGDVLLGVCWFLALALSYRIYRKHWTVRESTKLHHVVGLMESLETSDYGLRASVSPSDLERCKITIGRVKDGKEVGWSEVSRVGVVLNRFVVCRASYEEESASLETYKKTVEDLRRQQSP